MLPAHSFLLPTQYLCQAAHKFSEIFPSKKPCSFYVPFSFPKEASQLRKIQAESRNLFPELYFPLSFCFCRCSRKLHTGAEHSLVNFLTPHGKCRLYRTPQFYTLRQKSDSTFHNPSHHTYVVTLASSH